MPCLLHGGSLVSHAITHVRAQLEERLVHVDRPFATLPPGWKQRPDGTFVDTVMNEESTEAPVGFQNEGSFKAYFVEVVAHVQAVWDRTCPLFTSNTPEAEQRQHAQGLPLDTISALLRIAKAPEMYLGAEPISNLKQQQGTTVHHLLARIFQLHVAPHQQACLCACTAGMQCHLQYSLLHRVPLADVITLRDYYRVRAALQQGFYSLQTARSPQISTHVNVIAWCRDVLVVMPYTLMVMTLWCVHCHPWSSSVYSTP